MVINEKALVSRMKEAYKTYGYTVAVGSEASAAGGRRSEASEWPRSARSKPA